MLEEGRWLTSKPKVAWTRDRKVRRLRATVGMPLNKRFMLDTISVFLYSWLESHVARCQRLRFNLS